MIARESLDNLRQQIKNLDEGVSHNTSESLFEWQLRRISMESTLLQVEVLLDLVERISPGVSFTGTDSTETSSLGSS